MELNLVLLAGMGVGLIIGMMLGIAVMCWLHMAQNDPIMEDAINLGQCPPCGGNCNQGRKCPARSEA